MQITDKNLFPVSLDSDSSNNWLVMKFGGTSVSTRDRWETICSLVKERQAAGFKVIIVHSALAGVSNQLEAILESAVDGYDELQLTACIEQHEELSTQLGIDPGPLLDRFTADLRNDLEEIHAAGEFRPQDKARVMALGELMSTAIGAAYLRQRGLGVTWMDARELLESRPVPSEHGRLRYLCASCTYDPDASLQGELAEKRGLIITQGFIARNSKGETVLLGRGGSDTSAAYFAAKLKAVGLEIWTDVPGMFSADPRLVSGARQLKALSYEEAREIASTGGSVLHPGCLRPLRLQDIPLRVRCTSQPALAGTLISQDPAENEPCVKALSSRQGITVVSMETLGMWREVGFLASAFRCFADLGLSIDLVSTAESNVTLTLDADQDAVDADTLDRLRLSLERLCRVEVIENAETISLVGQKIRAQLHEIGPAFEVFSEHRIHLVSQAANDLNLSFVVEEGQAHRLLQKLHAQLVRPTETDSIFGPTWDELQADKASTPSETEPWWSIRRESLLAIGAEKSSAYVYHAGTIRTACERLTSLTNVGRVFYAIKANSHPGVLRTVHAAGVDFECVSVGEIEHVLKLFPGIDPGRILFTPNFAPRAEYEYALDKGVMLTLDDIYPLREWGEIFAGEKALLRLDTGQGRGHHEHVRTAGVYSKFGIPMFELEEVRRLAQLNGLRVIGLHAHTGSGILQPDNWRSVAKRLMEAARQFPDVRILDLGGGLGVPESPRQGGLDLAQVDASLENLSPADKRYELWLEPGRYVVAEAGVLLAQVTQVKGKGKTRYVGVSTGMNSLIRPPLYGAYHEIVNLSRMSESPEHVVNIVGPICESGDRLGADRLLPRCREGDLLLIANAGAYGHVMGSSYNMREPAVEIVIEDEVDT